MLLLWILGLVTKCSGQNYSDGLEIMRTKLKADNYNPDQRPLINQSAIISVSVSFQLVSIVEVNDVTQSFVCNGFFPLTWTDEILAWEPSDYGGLMSIHPLPEAVWRPRVVLLNTIDKRDLFGDDKAPLNVESTGLAHWIPGSLFLTSCELDMTKYPFDKHTCFIQLIAMTYQTHELHFIAPKSPEVGLTFYTPHGEWNLLKTTIEAFNDTSGSVKSSSIKISFDIQRRPLFLMINIVLPVIFLSFLNILVFLIPADSGEKIGYGITVLLALSVFLSIVGGMLPRSSKSMPEVTMYLFILLIISMLTVLDSIAIVCLHHMEEKETKHLRAKHNYKSAIKKVNTLRQAVTGLNGHAPTGVSKVRLSTIAAKLREQGNAKMIHLPDSPDKGNNHENDSLDNDQKSYAEYNKYKIIGKYIDKVSLVVFLVVWLAVTAGFMLDIASPHIF